MSTTTTPLQTRPSSGSSQRPSGTSRLHRSRASHTIKNTWFAVFAENLSSPLPFPTLALSNNLDVASAQPCVPCACVPSNCSPETQNLATKTVWNGNRRSRRRSGSCAAPPSHQAPTHPAPRQETTNHQPTPRLPRVLVFAVTCLAGSGATFEKTLRKPQVPRTIL